MGKTKTAFIADTPEDNKSSLDKLREKRERQAAAAKAQSAKETKEEIHIAGLKGGQRIKIVEAEIPAEAIPTEEGGKQQKTKSKKAPKSRGKKYQEMKAKVDGNKLYSVKEAISLAKKTSFSDFDGSVEVHFVVKKVGISVNVTLPHSAGKEKKIEIADEATIKKLEAGKIDFDVLIATIDMMPKLVPFAKTLGPKGLMPNPKNGTLVKDVKSAKSFGGNSITVKTEKEAPLIHTVIGKVSQNEKELSDNLEVILKGISDKQIIKAYLKATMGPSIKLMI